jgi:lycopene cyclase domain-containing protein
MTYTVLAVLAVSTAVVWDLLILRTRLVRSADFWMTYAILFGFQLIANGVLTGMRVVRYNPQAILGVRLVYAPIEDVAFGFALITITLSCWTWAGAPPAASSRIVDDALTSQRESNA